MMCKGARMDKLKLNPIIVRNELKYTHQLTRYCGSRYLRPFCHTGSMVCSFQSCSVKKVSDCSKRYRKIL